MEYLEYRFVNTGPEINEILMAFLDAAGYSGFVETSDDLTAYIPVDQSNENALHAVLEMVSKDLPIEYLTSVVPVLNWNESWEKSFQPIEIDDHVRIRASFHKKTEGFRYDLVIDPKMSFGTGHHETTRLMIRAMSESDLTGDRILDLGCGTGILGILASKMGAGYVLAIDIDEWACDNCRENIRANGSSNMVVRQGGIEQAGEQTFDVILANINRNVLLGYMDVFGSSLEINGIIILSGIMEPDRASVLAASGRAGFILKSEFTEGKWICLVLSSQNRN